MIEIIVEEGMVTGDRPGMSMPSTMKKRKRKYETFKVSDDVFSKFRNGKTKFERWSKYLDLKDESQKKIYDYAKRHHNGIIILQNATTGAVRGIRFNRNGGGYTINYMWYNTISQRRIDITKQEFDTQSQPRL